MPSPTDDNLRLYLRRNSLTRKEWMLIAASVLVAIAALDFLIGVFLPPAHKQDSVFGWDMNAAGTGMRTVRDSLNEQRTIRITWHANGFKRWHPLTNERPRVFIVGDSLAEMIYVNNGEEWYAFLERAFPKYDFYVKGGRGYGSLQEYLVLDKYHDQIRPNVVLWQFCNNDYQDNLYEYDLAKYPYNNQAVRPYLENGKIRYRLPLPFAGLRKFSSIADRLLLFYDRYRWARAMSELDAVGGQPALMNKDEERRLRLESETVTTAILQMARKRAPSASYFFFDACGPLGKRERGMCDKANLTCVDGVIDKQMATRADYKIPNDGHWNKQGNEELGKRLAARLKEYKEFQGD